MPAAPTGFRRLTPSLLQADRTAEGFDGLPDGVTVPGQLLAAFKAAAPRLGLSPRLVHAVDWLFRFTQPQDWGRGGRPIVWPSASMQQEALGLSPTRAKAINRALIEAGLITMKDSPNGKRYGKRDPKGRIVEAYGFDLSPIAARHAEFVRLAEEAQGGARRDGPAAPAGDDRPQGHHPDPRDGGRIRLRRARNGRAWPARPATSPGRSGRSSGPRRWHLASRAWSGGSVRRGNAWKTCWPRSTAGASEAVNSGPLGGRKTAPTNIPTNQV